MSACPRSQTILWVSMVCCAVREDTHISASWWDARWRTAGQLDFGDEPIFQRWLEYHDRRQIWTTWKEMYKDMRDRISTAALIRTVEAAPTNLATAGGRCLLLKGADRSQLAALSRVVALLERVDSSVLQPAAVVQRQNARYHRRLEALLGPSLMREAVRLTAIRLAISRERFRLFPSVPFDF